ncbi:MAG: DUF2712 domain-containing protein [Paeniclostridium sordellii]|nr:DUF2712 domain-containing protein [Paeniclostridium sordellii]
MKIRKLGSKIMIPLAVGMILVGGVIPSFANNHSDTGFKFTYTPRVQYTKGRAKTDYTSSWIKCDYMTPGWTACATVIAVDKEGNRRDVGSKTYGFKSGSGMYLTNFVKERGYSIAEIASNAIAMSSGSYLARGVWSPDSI